MAADGVQPARDAIYWRRTLQLTVALLLVWFAVTFGVAYLARPLSFRFFGWPFSFWVGAQGSLLVYGLLIGCYAWAMDRVDAAHAARSAD
jgi:putative solute:sodium symporter small subunit